MAGAELRISGVVNGFEFDGHGRSVRDGEAYRVTLTDIPTDVGSVHVYASGGSIVCFANTMLAPAEGDAVSLRPAVGDGSTVHAEYLYFDEAGVQVGSLRQDGDITSFEDDVLHGSVRIEGDVPPGLLAARTTPGYVMTSDPAGDDGIDGNYVQLFAGGAGERYRALVRREYKLGAAHGLRRRQSLIYASDEFTDEFGALTVDGTSRWVRA